MLDATYVREPLGRRPPAPRCCPPSSSAAPPSWERYFQTDWCAVHTHFNIRTAAALSSWLLAKTSMFWISGNSSHTKYFHICLRNQPIRIAITIINGFLRFTKRDLPQEPHLKHRDRPLLSNSPFVERPFEQNMLTPFDLHVSSSQGGRANLPCHANLPCTVPTLADDPRRESFVEPPFVVIIIKSV